MVVVVGLCTGWGAEEQKGWRQARRQASRCYLLVLVGVRITFAKGGRAGGRELRPTAPVRPKPGEACHSDAAFPGVGV